MDFVRTLKTFTTAAASSSLSEVARSQYLTPSAVSKQIAALEQYLGCALFARSARGLQLTNEGQAYLPRAIAILGSIAEARDAVRKDAAEPSGSMSIAAPAVFGRRHISPGVAEFAASNPKLSIDLRLMERQVDPGTAGADVCFRIGGLADSDYIATKVGRTRRALCASPGYVTRFGAIASPQMLSAHNCLLNSLYSANSTWYFTKDGEIAPVRVKGSFTANNSECLRAAALAGVGIGLLGTWSVDEDLRAGRLVELLSGWTGEVTKASRDIFMVYRRADRNDPAKQALITFFKKRFAATATLRNSA